MAGKEEEVNIMGDSLRKVSETDGEGKLDDVTAVPYDGGKSDGAREEEPVVFGKKTTEGKRMSEK